MTIGLQTSLFLESNTLFVEFDHLIGHLKLDLFFGLFDSNLLLYMTMRLVDAQILHSIQSSYMCLTTSL